MSRTFLTVLATLTLLAPAGCQQRRADKEPSPFERPAIDRHLSVVVDASGSFRQHLARDGRPFQHLMQVVQAFFQAGAGAAGNDRLVLAQISGSSRSILFEGTPREFQESFRNPEELRCQLLTRSDPSGSRVRDTLHEVVAHALATEGVRRGRTRLALLVLSDMEDTHADTAAGVRLTGSLEDLARAGGVVGLHWLPQGSVAPWRDYLLRCGFNPARVSVTPDFQPNVPLPGF